MMECDGISELPDCLLTQILLNLPTKDSIKKSVLSTRWRNLWLNVNGLDLKLKEFPLNGEKFASFMDRFMEFNHGSRLQKLMIKNNHYKINTYSDILKELIATAVDRGIQHLDFESMNIKNYIDFMPMNIYKSKILVSLKLVNIGLENPKIVVSLPCLKIMHLEKIFYGTDDGPLIMEKLFSGCPVLEDLTVVKIFYKDIMPLLRVRIVVKNLSSLFKIDLDTDFNVKYGGSPSKPNDLRKRDMILGFFVGISSVQYMFISQPTLKVIYRYSVRGQIIPNFYNLSHLQASFSSSSLHYLLVFLESCPNLKNLILDFCVSTTESRRIGLTNVPRCLTSTLECVEINKLIIWEGTGTNLVQYLLENSAVLMKLNLNFTDHHATNEQLDIFKWFVTSKKLSRKFQVFFN